MRVFEYKNNIYNVDDDCPSISKYVASGAEEINVSIFQGLERFADNKNTKKVNGEWVFTIGQTQQESEASSVAERARKIEIGEARDASGIKKITIEQAIDWIDSRPKTVAGNRAILKKIIAFILE